MKRTIRGWFRQLAYRHDQWSLQKRLILSYVVIMLIPSILISLFIFNELAGSYVRDALKKNEYALELELVNVDNNIETMERTAQLTDSNPDVLEYLVKAQEPETAELIEFNRQAVSSLERLQYNNPNIEHIRLFTDNPRISELYPIFWREERIAGEPWHPVVNRLNGMEYWHISPNDNELVRRHVAEDFVDKPKISLLREIEYPAGKHAGILAVEMRLANFFPKAYRRFDGEQAQLLIVDRKGDIYYNRDNPFLADAGVTDELLREAIDFGRRDHLGNVRFQAGATPMLAVLTYVERLDVHMVNIVSLEQSLMEMSRTRNQLIAANVILLGILSVATYFLNALILKRLHILAASMKKARQGDFSFDIPVRGGGEVGELAHHFRKMLNKINELIADAVNKKAASKETELRSLKNQIDSHFLYNTLENIKMMAEVEGRYDISDALTSLGGMMRYNLKWTSEYVRLRDETAHIANYIAIMNMRFDRQVKLAADIPEPYYHQELLKMSLQPIVENAVKHGFRPERGTDMAIRISAERQEGAMVIAICDDGAGMSAGAAAELNRKLEAYAVSPGRQAEAVGGGRREGEGSGIGLVNVQQRLRLFYGAEYGLRIESEAGRYTRVVMRIPYFILTGSGGDA